MSKKITNKKRATIVAGVEAFIVYGFSASLSEHHWSDAVLCFSIAAGIPLWIYLTHKPGYCGATKPDGESCRNWVKGQIWGCYHHTYQRPLENLHLIRVRPERVTSAQAHDQENTARMHHGVGVLDPVPVKVVGDARDQILFWINVANSVTGILALGVTIFGPH